MSKRTERREAERAARKAACLELRRQQSQSAQIQETAAPSIEIPAAEPTHSETTEIQVQAAPPQLTQAVAEPTPTISEAQLIANQANAQLSTGPSTAAGKAISSQNALKHGLTSQAVVLPTEDVSAYEHLLRAFIEGLNPVTEDELRLVQTMVDSQWRINRCQRFETALLMKAQIELASMYPDQTPANRRALIDVEAYLKYEKSQRNLQIQESRLRRLFDKAQAELHQLQMLRKQEERAAERAQSAHNKAASPGQPQPNGFDFSNGRTQPTTSPKRLNSAAAGRR